LDVEAHLSALRREEPSSPLSTTGLKKLVLFGAKGHFL
jgi:hypothetical protein